MSPPIPVRTKARFAVAFLKNDFQAIAMLINMMKHIPAITAMAMGAVELGPEAWMKGPMLAPSLLRLAGSAFPSIFAQARMVGKGRVAGIGFPGEIVELRPGNGVQSEAWGVSVRK